MKWVNGLSTKVSLEAALDDVTRQVLRGLEGESPDIGFLFVSNTFASEYPRLLPLLAEKIQVQYLIGCSGGGVVGNGQELEDLPAISLTVAHLPLAGAKTFYIAEEDLPDLDSPPDRWHELIGIEVKLQPNFVILGDPFSFPVNDLLQGLDFAYPSAVKVGGLASGGGLGTNTLFCSRDRQTYQLYRKGLVGMALWGGITIDAVVAQGCRPIGEALQVSDCDRNIILSLDDRSPLEALQDIVGELNERDRDLAQHSLFVGVVMNEFKQSTEQGDFLIRNIIGVDPKTGAIAVGDRVRPGQRIQLHLRDADASAADLEENLRRYKTQNQTNPTASDPLAAVMFSCLGRGERLYGKPNFDSTVFAKHIGEIPVGGFFCGGEIGPVGGTTFLHGYTSVFGIFRPV
jgi:small ligand-binding sensory domain FIST